MKGYRRILLITVLFLLLRFNLSYALFKTVKNSTGTLSTAKWSISLNQAGENNYLSVVSGDNTSSADYNLNITNGSEVNAVYSVVINGLPAGVSVSFDDHEFIPEVNNKVIFNEIDTINSKASETHKLTFKAESGSALIDNKEVDINVIARQTV